MFSGNDLQKIAELLPPCSVKDLVIKQLEKQNSEPTCYVFIPITHDWEVPEWSMVGPMSAHEADELTLNVKGASACSSDSLGDFIENCRG